MNAPEWTVSQWFNTEHALHLKDFRGRVVILHTFQMLCPGCVSHGLPQAQRVFEMFSDRDVAVIGLHTVFEHHEAMPPVALEAFLHEYRLRFPVGIDTHVAGEATPVTMKKYGLQGTPSLVLIDKAGDIQASVFGRPNDLWLGSALERLIDAPIVSAPAAEANVDGFVGCDDTGCRVPPRQAS